MMLKNLQESHLGRQKRDELNEKEMEILKLICDQKNNGEIADQLHLSRHTVNSYRNKLLEKTASHNTAGLVLYAVKNGIYLIE